MSARAHVVALLAVLTFAGGCLPMRTATADVQDPAAQERTAVLALVREDFETARPRLLELASHCRSGEHGRRAVLLLAAAELDTGNEGGSPQAALQLARSYLLLPETPREEAVVARALYRLAADLGGEAAPATTDSTSGGILVAPRFDDCEQVPDLLFRPLPSTSSETLADREKTLRSTLAVRSDSIAALRDALAESDRRVTELESELERITELLTSGAERRIVVRP
jgi:hypothetical protein